MDEDEANFTTVPDIPFREFQAKDQKDFMMLTVKVLKNTGSSHDVFICEANNQDSKPSNIKNDSPVWVQSFTCGINPARKYLYIISKEEEEKHGPFELNLEELSANVNETIVQTLREGQDDKGFKLEVECLLKTMETEDMQKSAMLTVKVLAGRKDKKEFRPRPSVCIDLHGQKGRRREHYKNSKIWTRFSKYVINPVRPNFIGMTLKEWRYDHNPKEIDVNKELLNRNGEPSGVFQRTYEFEEGFEVDFEFSVRTNPPSEVRCSKDLCEQENEFLKTRRQRVFDAMTKILGKDEAPSNLDEVPTIAVLGSGGGFRALAGMTGVFKALGESEVLDMVTYVAGVSGSTWFLSHLYSHDEWPEKTPRDLIEETESTVLPKWKITQWCHHWFPRVLRKLTISFFLMNHGRKVLFGQLPNLMESYGLFIGEKILPKRMDAKLTDQRKKIEDGSIPMPIYTCLLVKSKVPAKTFHEWIEFTPYEIGSPKYGAFIPSELFSSTFYRGRVTKKSREPPLYYLQAIWGSCLVALFKEWKGSKSSEHREGGEIYEKDDEDEAGVDDTSYWSWFASLWRKPLEIYMSTRVGRAAKIPHILRGLSLGVERGAPVEKGKKRHSRTVSRWRPIWTWLKALVSTPPHQSEPPIFGEINDKFASFIPNVYLGDAGLAFNSPYPPLLRRERKVDILLSFDFTQREQDAFTKNNDGHINILKELKHAERWACIKRIKFPVIDEDQVDTKPEHQKECYIFKNYKDPECPVVMHFVLANINFKNKKASSPLQWTKDGVKFDDRDANEKEYARFPIFDDAQECYCSRETFYSEEAFDKITGLTEFNTLWNVGEIIKVTKEVIKNKQNRE